MGADSVENCWEMVSECECKNVADDSDDDKRSTGRQKLEVLRNVAAHNLKRIVRVSFAIGRRQISPSMPYYSSSTSSTVPFASLTSSPTAWNSQFPNNWSRTSLWVLIGSFFACGKFEYFRSQCPDVISLFSDLLISQIFPRSRLTLDLPCHAILFTKY